MTGVQLAEVVHFYDRRFHPSIQIAWQDGLPAKAPVEVDPLEWRACAKRLAKHLGTTVRTGMKQGTVWAVANGGYPLGLTDPVERDLWMRQRADGRN